MNEIYVQGAYQSMCAHSLCVFWADDLGVCLRRSAVYNMRLCGDVTGFRACRSFIHLIRIKRNSIFFMQSSDCIFIYLIK